MNMLNIGEIIASKKPYVYALTYPNGLIFYIGKGKGKRIYDHNGSNGDSTKTLEVITAIQCSFMQIARLSKNVSRKRSQQP